MKKLALAVIVAALGGCAKNITMSATGGSKADGIVEMSYEIGGLDKPIVDEAQALKDAQRRCEAWGYKRAEPFGGYRRQCNMMGGLSGCAQWFVTKQYQCLDN